MTLLTLESKWGKGGFETTNKEPRSDGTDGVTSQQNAEGDGAAFPRNF
jgi:hypothetical protein